MNSKYYLNIFCMMVGFVCCFMLLGKPMETFSLSKLQLIKTFIVSSDNSNNENMFNNSNPTTNLIINGGDFNSQIAQFRKLEKEMSSTLYNSTKILCWIMHSIDRVNARKSILETWGKRCNLVLFVVGNKSADVSRADPLVIQMSPNAQLVVFQMQDHYELLWLKTRTAFKYISKIYKNRFDYVYKLDDDTYVIMENLRLFLNSRKPQENAYFGCQYSTNAPRGYISGGPGYIMSNYVVEKFVTALNANSCNQGDGGPEDVHVGNCLASLGVYPADTRDTFGRFRFSPFIPEQTLDKSQLPSRYGWFFGFSAHPLKDGFECCSDTAIAYHYVSPSLMRTMEYLIYYLHPFSTRD